MNVEFESDLKNPEFLEIQLSGQTHAHEPFHATARILIHNGMQKISIPWSTFLLDEETLAPYLVGSAPSEQILMYDNQGYRYRGIRFPKGASIDPAIFPISTFTFRLRQATARDSNESLQSILRINGPIYRDFNLHWIATAPEDFLNDNAINRYTRDGKSDVRSAEFLNFFATQLDSKEAQEYALHIVSQGHEAIESELKRYGFKMIETPKKLTADEFFKLLQYQNGYYPIPIESGVFAEHHGRYTHAAQILVLTYKASEKNLKGLHDFQRLFADVRPDWRNLWNILFDAPGNDGANAPAWWVEQFKNHINDSFQHG